LVDCGSRIILVYSELNRLRNSHGVTANNGAVIRCGIYM